MIVVDTNVISELMKVQPSESVRQWALAQEGALLYTTAITLAEILYGIERLPSGERKELLRSTAMELFATFTDKVLPFDASAAAHYSRIVDSCDRLGHPIDGFDAQIAAICRSNNHALATRNTKDFKHAGVDLIDPWHAR